MVNKEVNNVREKDQFDMTREREQTAGEGRNGKQWNEWKGVRACEYLKKEGE